MDKEKLFVSTFVIALLTTALLFGGSMTGYVLQSMQCDSTGCRELCKFQPDCSDSDHVCCYQSDFPLGVCISEKECDRFYTLSSPNGEISQFSMGFINKPLLESPAAIQKGQLLLYGSLSLITISIGYLYLVLRRSHSSKNQKKTTETKLSKKKKNSNKKNPRAGKNKKKPSAKRRQFS